MSGTSAIVVLGGQIGHGVESTEKRICQVARNSPMLNINIPFLPAHRKAWLVGGAVRDILRGKKPLDLDIIVAENAYEYAWELARRLGSRAVELGRPPYCIYRVTKKKRVFDIADLKGESIREDLLKRDFSINAMAYELSSGQIIDIVSGRQDLLQKKIRMVSDTVFMEDPLRLLRALRLSAMIDFKIEVHTQAKMSEQAGLIKKSASERIQAELSKIFNATNSAPTVKAMDQIGLLEQILPEVTHLKNFHGTNTETPNLYIDTMRVLTYLEDLLNHQNIGSQFPFGLLDKPLLIQNPGLLKLASLLHDIGRPHLPHPVSDPQQKNELNCKKGAEMADRIMRRLTFSNHQRRYITFIISNHYLPTVLFKQFESNRLKIKSTIRFFRLAKEQTPDLLFHAVAKTIAPLNAPPKKSPPLSRLIRTTANILNCYYDDFLPTSRHPAFITGRDLINIFNLSPSPEFKTILDAIEEARLCGQFINRTDAIKWTKSFLNQNINWSGS